MIRTGFWGTLYSYTFSYSNEEPYCKDYNTIRIGNHLGFYIRMLPPLDLRLQARKKKCRDSPVHGLLSDMGSLSSNIWALIIRIGFWGILYYNKGTPPSTGLNRQSP